MNLSTDKTARKEQPVARGVLDYFPNAIAEVAHVSLVGNQQHNPGQEMHWAREKSRDHADCIARHLIERGTVDDDGLRHSAKVAWRALAMLQLEIEADDMPKYEMQGYQPDIKAAVALADTMLGDTETPVEYTEDSRKLDEHLCKRELRTAEKASNYLARGAYMAERARVIQADPPPSSDDERRSADYKRLLDLGCTDTIAGQIVGGITYHTNEAHSPNRYVYVAGPMRGYEKFNFPAFDDAREGLLALGFNVISPADIDRAVNEAAGSYSCTQADFAMRDFWSLYFIGRTNGHICMLDGWRNSVGATAEAAIAQWIGLQFLSI